MKIFSRFDSEKVIYESTKETIKETVVEAVIGGADLRDADLGDAEFYQVKFYGRGGKTKIKKTQIDDFFIALGVVVED